MTDAEQLHVGAETKPDDNDFARLFEQGAQEATALPNLEDGAEPVEPPAITLDEQPKKRKYTRRSKMGPVPPEMEELFTPGGIGAVSTSALDAFLRLCAAPALLPEEKRNLQNVVAYYAQVRMPKDAGKYQPEMLLALSLSFVLIPRMGPIAQKTGPSVSGFFSWLGGRIRGLFGRKNAEQQS